MSAKKRPDLLSSLRVMDEHWGQVEPNPAFEQRLLLRLQPPKKQQRASISIRAGFRQYGRPLGLVFAAIVVLLLSVTDQVPAARSGIVVPRIPDAAIEPVEIPEEDRFEPAQPHNDEGPPNVPRVPTDPTNPTRLDTPLNQAPNFPEENEFEEFFPRERVVPKVWAPGPHRSSAPHSETAISDFLPYWSSGSTRPGEAPTRPSTLPNQWGGGGSTRSKPPSNGSSAVCFTKEDLKKRAAATCEKNGLVLSDIYYINPCKDGLFQHAEHECAEPIPEEDPCQTGTVTDGDQCVDPGQLKMLAYTACKMAMLDMVDFTYTTGDCGWKTRQATYTCCPFPTPEPQPPMVCQDETIGDGVTCMDPGKLKEDAYYLCQGLGQVLMDIVPLMDCPNGLSSWAKISCCKQ